MGNVPIFSIEEEENTESGAIGCESRLLLTSFENTQRFFYFFLKKNAYHCFFITKILPAEGMGN